MKTKERREADLKWRLLAPGANGSQHAIGIRHKQVEVFTITPRLSQAQIAERRAANRRAAHAHATV